VRRSDMDAELAELYALIPEIPDCKGRCWMSCGPIDMGGRERQRLREAGYKITDRQAALAMADHYWCEALDGAGRCAAYDRRPAICRIWGTAKGLPCPYGCKPERWLTDNEAYDILTRCQTIGGGGAYAWGGHTAAELMAELNRVATESGVDPVAWFFAKGRADDRRQASRWIDLPPQVTRRPVSGQRP
jgi:uncharacterized protein